MNFLNSNSPPIFLCKEEELDHLIFKERMARLNKQLNFYLADMSNEDSYLFSKWIMERKLWCELCNKQFYSNAGFVNHGCLK